MWNASSLNLYQSDRGDYLEIVTCILHTTTNLSTPPAPSGDTSEDHFQISLSAQMIIWRYLFAISKIIFKICLQHKARYYPSHWLMIFLPQILEFSFNFFWILRKTSIIHDYLNKTWIGTSVPVVLITNIVNSSSDNHPIIQSIRGFMQHATSIDQQNLLRYTHIHWTLYSRICLWKWQYLVNN